MTKKKYNKMILDALATMNIQDEKIREFLLCMLIDDIVPDNTYVKKEYVIGARERIATIMFLKGFKLLKEDYNAKHPY